jgi:hypothetical protein
MMHLADLQALPRVLGGGCPLWMRTLVTVLHDGWVIRAGGSGICGIVVESI